MSHNPSDPLVVALAEELLATPDEVVMQGHTQAELLESARQIMGAAHAEASRRLLAKPENGNT